MTLTFRVKLLLGYVALVAVAELLTVAALDRSISSELTAQLARRLEAQALGAVEWVSAGRNPDVVATRLAHVVGARVTVLDQSGRLVGDSESIENATVIAPECLYADALTKPVLLCGMATAVFLQRFSARAVVLG